MKLRVVVSKRGNFKVKKLDSGTRVGQFPLPTPLRVELGLTPIIKIGCPTCGIELRLHMGLSLFLLKLKTP